MSLNDTSLGAMGADIHPGVANPTASSNNANPMDTNFVSDPTSKAHGAGAGAHFKGDRQAAQAMKQAAGVIEARPGIIESTHIAPLNDDPNRNGMKRFTDILYAHKLTLDDAWKSVGRTTEKA
ncbi:hypothetical protein ARMGADRAFT_1076928 [Armillaria gallica]|uniref:Uncharacterized protein n=1 Tax=Armillaria gallica TaxID=47427 RepID=A0A2H3EAW8_ARMGA|nr:hypothetical protein ARMGADRAFT_1076928 [Armillaria gallica]